MTKQEVNTKLANFFKEARKDCIQKIRNDVTASKDLYQDGWLDSLLSVGLIQFMEKEFSVKFSPFDFTKKNFINIDALSNLVQKNINGWKFI